MHSEENVARIRDNKQNAIIKNITQAHKTCHQQKTTLNSFLLYRLPLRTRQNRCFLLLVYLSIGTGAKTVKKINSATLLKKNVNCEIMTLYGVTVLSLFIYSFIHSFNHLMLFKLDIPWLRNSACTPKETNGGGFLNLRWQTLSNVQVTGIHWMLDEMPNWFDKCCPHVE